MAEDQPQQLQQFVINSQYVKDLSFENPGAPGIYNLLTQQQPQLAVALDVKPTQIGERGYEVVLSLRVEARVGEQIAFLVELDYAGIVSYSESLPAAEREVLLFIETPRHLFPFARAIVASVTREGGFPPVVINPINFLQWYQTHKQNAAQGAAAATGGNGQDPAAPPAEGEANRQPGSDEPGESRGATPPAQEKNES